MNEPVNIIVQILMSMLISYTLISLGSKKVGKLHYAFIRVLTILFKVLYHVAS